MTESHPISQWVSVSYAGETQVTPSLGGNWQRHVKYAGIRPYITQPGGFGRIIRRNGPELSLKGWLEFSRMKKAMGRKKRREGKAILAKGCLEEGCSCCSTRRQAERLQREPCWPIFWQHELHPTGSRRYRSRERTIRYVFFFKILHKSHSCFFLF